MPKKSSPECVGVLGGTFNPPHLGHIALGLTVLDNFHLHSIHYVLSALPPHKSGQQILDASVRFGLLEQALAPFPNLIADDIEVLRPSPSWTILTIDTLMANWPGRHFYFICGSEAFLAIQTWYNYPSLLDKIGFLVFLRNPTHHSALIELCAQEGIQVHPIPPTLPKAREVTLFSVPEETRSISSTQIRKNINSGLPYEHMVPDTIIKTIKENNLYA